MVLLALQRAAGNSAVVQALAAGKGDPKVAAHQKFLNQYAEWPLPILVEDGKAGSKTDTADRANQWREGRPIVGYQPGVPDVIETHGGGV